jgi:hypothetical protein
MEDAGTFFGVHGENLVMLAPLPSPDGPGVRNDFLPK